MFTVEFDEDETLITILDGDGALEDVSALLYDDYCYIRQWNEKEQRFSVIALNAKMYLELMKAWNCPQGAYMVDTNKK